MGSRLYATFVCAALSVMVILFLFPPLWIVGLSLKTRLGVFAEPPLLFWRPTIANYAAVLHGTKIIAAFVNSLVVSTGALLLSCRQQVCPGYDGKLVGIPYRVTTGIPRTRGRCTDAAGIAGAPGSYDEFLKTARSTSRSAPPSASSAARAGDLRGLRALARLGWPAARRFQDRRDLHQ
ncbi:MAG: hypothetical protein J2P47_01005 [Acetobacteraceae bacterium]|nr:hypothetical protein [Acetobacteraceae bacterium]